VINYIKQHYGISLTPTATTTPTKATPPPAHHAPPHSTRPNPKAEAAAIIEASAAAVAKAIQDHTAIKWPFTTKQRDIAESQLGLTGLDVRKLNPTEVDALVAAALGGHTTLSKSAGIKMGDAIINGIEAGMSKAAIKKDSFQKFIDDIKKLFRISSPSGVFSDIGANIVKGLLQGVTGNEGVLGAAGLNIVKSVLQGANSKGSTDQLTGVFIKFKDQADSYVTKTLIPDMERLGELTTKGFDTGLTKGVQTGVAHAQAHLKKTSTTALLDPRMQKVPRLKKSPSGFIDPGAQLDGPFASGKNAAGNQYVWNIEVNNPVPEPAGASITRTMEKIQYHGLVPIETTNFGRSKR
jgi:hypothetical protein